MEPDCIMCDVVYSSDDVTDSAIQWDNAIATSRCEINIHDVCGWVRQYWWHFYSLLIKSSVAVYHAFCHQSWLFNHQAAALRVLPVCLSVCLSVPHVYYLYGLYACLCAECVGYRLDYSNYVSSVILISSSNSASSPDALVGSEDPGVWKATPDDVDSDGDFVYSILLKPDVFNGTARRGGGLRRYTPGGPK